MSSFSSLYVHFPFCESKCHYCDFYSLGRERTKPGDPPQFLAALEREATLWADRLEAKVDTIFFGGGTPSMTPAADMARALAPLQLERRVHSRTEWTMEANPSSIDRANFAEYRSLGLNRVSMGVQALRPDLLALLGRVHSREQALQALETVFASGFDNVSVDLLCGAPGQSLEDLGSAMEALTSFPITHLSCYLLTLPKHHRMFSQLPGEETQLQHLLFIHEWMTGKGFEHYEISNFAKPGFRAKHNLCYWQGQSYLGLGPSAHSFDSSSASRWKNFSSLHRYAETLAKGEKPVEWSETLNPEQQGLERWMLALRLSDGFPESWLERQDQQARARSLIQHGLLVRHHSRPERLRLTPRGFAVSDQVIASLAES